MKKIFTLIAVIALACSSAFAMKAVKLESKGQWAEFGLSDQVPFGFDKYVGYKVTVGEMDGTFQVTLGSVETSMVEVSWSSTPIEQSNFTSYNPVQVGENTFADFAATFEANGCTEGIRSFNIQCCDGEAGSTIEILKVVLITPDGEEVVQDLGVDAWGGGAYVATEIETGDEPGDDPGDEPGDEPEVAVTCIVVAAEPQVENPWDTQFFISWGAENALEAGDVIEYSVDIKADAAANCGGFQFHKAPGEYVDWKGAALDFTTGWTTTTYSGIVAEDGGEIGAYTLASNLSLEGEANVYYFTNISVKINGEEMMVNPDCTGEDLSQYYAKVYPGTEPVVVDPEMVVSGINSIVAAPVQDNRIFNIWGVQVDENYRGIVISNGKKYIQR